MIVAVSAARVVASGVNFEQMQVDRDRVAAISRGAVDHQVPHQELLLVLDDIFH